MPRKKLIQVRRDTLANFVATNPVLAAGEPFFITDTFESGYGTGAAFNSTPRGTGIISDLAAASLTQGMSNMPRPFATSSGAVVSGTIHLTYFTAIKEILCATMRMLCAATAAGATPTMVKYGLFSVASNGDLTRIGITANDTGIFAAANTSYSRALLAAATVSPGLSYATGLLVITAAALPTPAGQAASSVSSAITSGLPRLSGAIAGQTDINASYAAASVANTGNRFYAEVLT